MRLQQVGRLLTSIASKEMHLPLAIIGESGVGKSALVKQTSKELEIGCIDLRLSQMESGDLIGIPRAHGDKTVWLKPHWWPEEGTRGILFLDELNRAPVEVRQAVFQLLTEWKMHEHVLPKGWAIVTAMNPEGKAGYQVEVLDPAMINRMLQVSVDLSVDDWLAWAHKTKIHQAVIGFISSQKSLLHKVKEQGAFPSPRTWEYVSNLLEFANVEETCLTEVIAGLVGSEAAASFTGWIKKNYERPVSAEEILKEYGVVQERVRTQTRSQNNVTATDLAALLTSKHKDSKKLTKDERSSVRKFIFDLGGDEEKGKMKHDDVVVAFLKKLPPSLLSLEIVCEESPEADKLAKLCNSIAKSASIEDEGKKEKKSK